MAYLIKFKPSAEKELDSLPQKDSYRIKTALVGLETNPFSGKRLEGEYKGCCAIRVWPYRVIYQIYKKELLVLIIRIGHRQGVY